MSATATIGAITDEERAVIEQRERYHAEFAAAETEGAAEYWLAKMIEATERFDTMRVERWRREGREH